MKTNIFVHQFHISRAHHKGRSRRYFVDYATDHENCKTKTNQDNTAHSTADGADLAASAKGSGRTEEGVAVERHVPSSRSSNEHLEDEGRADRSGHYELLERFHFGTDTLQRLTAADIGEDHQAIVQQVRILG